MTLSARDEAGAWAMVIWMLALGVCTGAMAMAAGGRLQAVFHLIAVLVAVFLALSAVRDIRGAHRAGAGALAAAAVATRYLTITWLWGATTVFIVYAAVIEWAGCWWAFVAGSVTSAAICAVLGRRVARMAEDGESDAAVGLARLLANVHLAAGAIAIVKLVAVTGLPFKDAGWAASSITLCGALALIVIAWAGAYLPACRPAAEAHA
jgi:hypothetical protein